MCLELWLSYFLLATAKLQSRVQCGMLHSWRCRRSLADEFVASTSTWNFRRCTTCPACWRAAGQAALLATSSSSPEQMFEVKKVGAVCCFLKVLCVWRLEQCSSTAIQVACAVAV